MELLKRKKTQGAQSLRCRKRFPKLFEDMKKGSPILEKIVMKFFMNFKFKLDKFYYLSHGTLSTALLSVTYIFDAWHFVISFFLPWKFENSSHEKPHSWKFLSSFFFSLTDDTLSAVFCPICYVCNVLLKRCEMFIVLIMFYF